jgi:glycogen debranching enzyme
MSDEEIKSQVKKLLLSNIVRGYSHFLKEEYCYIKPAHTTYPFQYFWDTCFHIFILCALGETELAKQNFKSLFQLQDEDGFVGHMIFWKSLLPTKIQDIFQAKPSFPFIRPKMSSLIQPPLIATALKSIYECTQDKEFLLKMLPKVKKYYKWLLENRDFEGEGLISIITSFESGMDYKSAYDSLFNYNDYPVPKWSLYLKATRIDFRNFIRGYNLDSIKRANYFILKDVLYNTFFIMDLWALEILCKEINDPKEKEYHNFCKKVTKKFIEVFYDEETCAFYDVYGRDNQKLKVLTATIFYPLSLEGIPNKTFDDVIEKHLFNQAEFETEYPIPSVAKSEPSFYPKESYFLWRGPTWVIHNWFLYKCLLSKGYRLEANKLLKTVKTLIKKSGFREYYNPLTGEGYGAENFTWSGLVVDMMRLNN